MMFGRKENVTVLLKRCDTDIKGIEAEYADSLDKKTIPADLQVDIKNLCANLRSVLDYSAHDIRETHCPDGDPKDRFYFPIFQTRANFQAQVKRSYPRLDTAAPDLWKYLESIQPYNPGFAWLGIFNKINNESKHGNLVAQTRTETEQIRVSFESGSVIWSPQNVKFGSGVFIGGVAVDPRTQMPIPDPSQKVERIVWVDFTFDGENVSALGLLKETLDGVKRCRATVILTPSRH